VKNKVTEQRFESAIESAEKEIKEQVVQENREKKEDIEEINDLDNDPKDNISEARFVEFADDQVNEGPKINGLRDETYRNSDNIQTPSFPNNGPETIFHFGGAENPPIRNVGIHQIPAVPNSPQNNFNVEININVENNNYINVEINNNYLNVLYILLIRFICTLGRIFYFFDM